MPSTDTAPDDARAASRRFIDAFNARDLEALRQLVTEDAEFRRLSGDALRGQDGARALLATADDLDLRLVQLRDGAVEEENGRVRLTVPVRELIGADDIERVAEFEISGGHIAAFAIRPYE